MSEATSAAPAAKPGGSPQGAPDFRLALPDDWELEADVRSVERLVDSLRALGSPSVAAGLNAADDIRAPVALYRTKPAEAAPRGDSGPAGEERQKSYLMAWTVLSLGLATFACGGVLLGWSLAGDRPDLWPLGLPLALVGQAGLVIGLVLQLDGLWHNSRRTRESLAALDDEIHRVRHATTLLTTTKNVSAQSFYAHLAEGASPQLLLADLKGQMDLLAQQLATHRAR